MADDPLSDPLTLGARSSTSSTGDSRTAFTSPTLAWAQSRPSDDLFAQPFQSNAWARHESDGVIDDGSSASAHNTAADDLIPSSSSSSSSTSSSASRPITMARASSLSRQRSPSTSAVKEGHEGALSSSFATSITPRGTHGFPFSSVSNVSTPTGAHHHHDHQQQRTLSDTRRHSSDHDGDNGDDSSNDLSTELSDLQQRKRLIVAACTSGHLRRLRKLLTPIDSSDSDVFLLANQPVTRSGLTPLHLAAGRGYLNIVEYLTTAVGAMAQIEDDEGETALHKAAYRGHLNVCQFLVEHGVSVDVVDRDGWSPLHNAASRGWLDIGRLLVDAGASVDALSKYRYTPLMNASSKGHLPFVAFLLKRGASPILRNAFDETAYDLAASVFELSTCHVLSTAERDVLGDESYHPVKLHSTYPVVVHENQRMARTSLRNLSTLGSLSGPSRAKWTVQALSRKDKRTAYTLPSVPGSDEENVPILKEEVGLPLVGDESRLVLPGRRQARSAGKIGKGVNETDADSRSEVSAAPGTVSSSSSTLRVPSGSSTPRPGLPAAVQSPHESAWFWLSDWTIDLTDTRSSPVDGWSYANSFDAEPNAWTSEPPEELEQLLQGDLSATLDGRKWVRRRRWVRLMRRRLDIPKWGFGEGDDGDREKRSAETSLAKEGTHESLDDYRARAKFLAGMSWKRVRSSQASASDQASIRSGKTIALDGQSSTDLDRAGLRRAAARLERAVDELRAGILSDDDASTKLEAEKELGEYLHELALIRNQLQDDDQFQEDDAFVYDGKDANDGNGLLTAARRPSSLLSGLSSRSTSGASIDTRGDDYFSQPVASTSTCAEDVAPHLSLATEFRVPTRDVPLTPGTPVAQHPATSSRTQANAATWEADDSAKACRRCGRKFSFFLRKHHCRRCGLLVCSYCSAHADVIDPAELVHEPGTSPLDDVWTQQTRYRTCDPCHIALNDSYGHNPSPSLSSRPARLSPEELFTRTTSTFTALSVSDSNSSAPPSASDSSTTDSLSSETGASDASELTECPVCGTNLARVGDRDAQESHVRDCLESGGGSIAQNGRYLTFKLAPGPLVGNECSICFEEFEVDERLARLTCLCYFHATCIKAWLERGKSCPLHAVRDML
ncbi:hypothetical protein ACM66B_000613 [Microbotryomycetes sp. NB124-2]